MIAESDISALKDSRPVVAAVGTYILDVLGRPVSELPRGQSGSRLEEIRVTAAGTAGGTAVDLRRLGAEVLAMGALGQDLAGDIVVHALQLHGIDTSGLHRRAGVQTSCTILPIHPDGSRPAWHVPGANSEFSTEQIDWEALDRADAVHLGGLTALPGLDGAPAARVLARARAAGALTTADFLGVRTVDAEAILTEVLPHVEILMPNEGEALAATGATDCVTAACRLRALGARCVIVKRGADPCLIVDADGARTVPAFDAPVIDTTGCGDAFCAGVIVARLAGWTIDQAANLGAATAALNLRALGSDAGARDLDEAISMLQSGPRRSAPANPGDDATLGELRELSGTI